MTDRHYRLKNDVTWACWNRRPVISGFGFSYLWKRQVIVLRDGLWTIDTAALEALAAKEQDDERYRVAS